MGKIIIPASLALLFVLAFSRAGEKDSIAVYFSPTGKDHRLTKAITEQLDQAGHEVRIAMYHWTSFKLAQTLVDLAKARKLSVAVLVDAQSFDIRGEDNRALNFLIDHGIPVKRVVLKGEGKGDGDSPRFHHKFCVVDRTTVLTGSYNWTTMGDEANYENLLVIQSESVAATYVKEFDRLWNDATITR